MFTARLTQPRTLCSPCIPARTFVVPRAGAGTNGVGAGEQAKRAPSKNINVISPVSQWADGIPPAMGGHYMPSGAASPLSQSKGPGIDVDPLFFAYPEGDLEVNVAIYNNGDDAALGLADLVAKASAEAVAARGAFTIALSGGSLPKSLSVLADRTDIDFSKWWVLWADERNVVHSSPDSNYKAAQEELLSKIPVPAEQVLAIKENVSVDLAATDYAGRMLDLGSQVLPITEAGLPRIDLILLGIGPDGHTASLFPNTPQAQASTEWVQPVHNSPKPPPERITLSLSAINAAANIAVVSLGEGKAEVVQRVLEVQSLPGSLPAQLVRPEQGKLTWILDQPAAGKLDLQAWSLGGRKSPFHRSNVPA